MADENVVGESDGNGTNFLNLFASTRSIKAGYLISESATIGGDNTKKSVKASRGYNYLILAAKKAFNHLRHAFI